VGSERAGMSLEALARLTFLDVPCRGGGGSFLGAVGDGLACRAKRLPCRFLYDRFGSRLFEAICALPEYYPTRTEESILRERAEEIVAAVGQDVALSEFGSGSSAKTRILIEALLARQERLVYVPIDISVEFLKECAHALLRQYQRLWLKAIGAEYDAAIPHLPRHDGARLILFLGSNIGNMEDGEASAFLARVAAEMQARDRLLVGFDLLKDARVIEAAYNDSTGVTAAFNKNLLTRINRELKGEFDLAAFDHAAPFVVARRRIEMRLVSCRAQRVRVGALGRAFDFAPGEYIHTENSHKYAFASFEQLCHAAGLGVAELWRDRRDWFALALLRKSRP
jgi:L-histidine N-alpha-methyltransferase